MGNLGMPGYDQQKRYYELLSTFIQIKDPVIWMGKNILGINFRKRILSDMGFAMKSQEFKEISFCIVFRKMTKFPNI